MIKMKRKKFILLIVSVVIATLFLASAAFFILSGAKGFVLVGKSDFDTMSEISERYAKLYAMQETVNDQFLWETDEEEQMNASIRRSSIPLEISTPSIWTKKSTQTGITM